MTAEIIPIEEPREVQPVCAFCKRMPAKDSLALYNQDRTKCMCIDCIKKAGERLKERNGIQK